MRLVFDRGTILIFGASRAADLAEIPGVVWDSRVSAHRVAGLQLAAVRDALSRSGRPFEDEIRHPGRIPSPWRDILLRPYQAAALEAWDRAGRRGVVVLPTGSGKTRLALAAMARTGLRTLCLVPTRALLEQWIDVIGESYDGPIGRFGDGERQEEPITVATFESAWRHMARLGNRFDLVIVDEAHHFGTGIRDEALEMSIADARLGLTATPHHDDRADKLAALMGPIVFQVSLGDLAGRYLADYERLTIELELTTLERHRYEIDLAAFRTVHSDFRLAAPAASWADFTRFAARTAEGRRALEAFRRMRSLLALTEAKKRTVATLLAQHRGSRTLVFTASNETAYTLARENLVMPITCHVGRKERTLALERFRKGELGVLVSSRVLNEGLDVPDADVAIVVGGALGEREHVQRIGRLLRPRPGKKATIYELVSRRTIEVRQARRRGASLAAGSADRP